MCRVLKAMGWYEPLIQHEVYEEINKLFTEEDVKTLQRVKKQRRERFGKIREELLETIKTDLEKKSREVDLSTAR